MRLRLALCVLTLILSGLLVYGLACGAALLLSDLDAPRRGAGSLPESRERLRRQALEEIRRLEKVNKGKALSSWPEESRQSYELAKQRLAETDE